MSSPQLQIGLRVSWKLCRNLCSQRWLRPNLNLAINLIPLGLWQLKIQLEDGLINFKILFLKAEKVLEFLIFKSKLFHSITVDGKKEFIKKLCLPLKWGILSLVLVLYALLMLGIILKWYSADWLWIFWKRSRVFYTIVFYGVILYLVLDKVFL